MAALFLLLAGLASSAGAVCPHEGIAALASNRDTWPRTLDITAPNITLDFPLLLDIATPRLLGLRIVAGGRLVFSPLVSVASITTDFIQIEEGGSLEIGSADCPFTGQAEILLTGKRGAYTTPHGEKFVAVERGGRLEVHGEQRLAWTRLAASVAPGRGPRDITLQGDVSSWREGDRLVIASSAGVNEAEEVEVIQCRVSTCSVRGRLRHNHFGNEESGVKMQAEVGLLSRNIVIRGEMEAYCYAPNPCEEVDYDTFGGHVIAREGFSSFRVEHAELRQMGQLGVLGRYPLHWHMAGQLVRGDSYVSSNAIHHTMQRCVTCHGSFGCLIEDNVSFDHLGHCYFLEDGVERDAVIRGNLGLGTRRTGSSGIPSDKDPATFWMTHPTALVTGNTAAGSDGKGFWFLQANLPTGASGRRQAAGDDFYFAEGELFRTPLGEISGNTAHSSTFGIFFDKQLLPDQGAGNSGNFNPREDPSDPRSPPVVSQVGDLTCYMVKQTCLWFHFNHGNFTGLRVADSREGMFSHDTTLVSDSIFVGETSNLGDDLRKRINKAQRFGFRNYLNPTLLSGVTFKGFTGSLPEGGSLTALGLRRIGSRSLYTGGADLTFVDTPLLGRMSEHKDNGRQFLYKDYTGSIAGAAGSYIVSNLPHMVSTQCRTAGKLAVCPHPYYTLATPAGTVELTRLDMLDAPFIPAEDNENFIALSSAHSHLLSFPRGIPLKGGRRKNVSFKLVGADLGTSLDLAICLPLDSSIRLAKTTRSVDSLAAFRADTEGSVSFHDQGAGLLWLRVVGHYDRQEGDFLPCGSTGDGCFSETIRFLSVGSDLSASCRARPGLLDMLAGAAV